MRASPGPEPTGCALAGAILGLKPWVTGAKIAIN
jgi:hypothetical protein